MTDREWNNKNQCTMSLVTHHYRRQREAKILEYIKKNDEIFSNCNEENVQGTTLTGRKVQGHMFHGGNICNMHGDIILRVKFIDPMGYELSE